LRLNPWSQRTALVRFEFAHRWLWQGVVTERQTMTFACCRKRGTRGVEKSIAEADEPAACKSRNDRGRIIAVFLGLALVAFLTVVPRVLSVNDGSRMATIE